MSTVPSVLNEIYVLKCDGCCNHISNMLIQYGREKKKSSGVFPWLWWRQAFAQEACKCQTKGGRKRTPNKTKPQRKHLSSALNCSPLFAVPALEAVTLSANGRHGLSGRREARGPGHGSRSSSWHPGTLSSSFQGAVSRAGAVLAGSPPTPPPLRAVPSGS